MTLHLFPWPESDRRPETSAAAIDLWTWDLDTPAEARARAQAHLSADEQERASRFVNEALASRWIMARGRLREILAGYLSDEPRDLAFELNPQGKPSVAVRGGERGIHFSLSHSQGSAGLAVSREVAVGFDLEILGEAPLDVVETVFSPAERAELESYTGAERHAAFYRGWTRKEAFVKALGMGLSYPLEQVEVSLSRTHPRVLRSQDEPASDWRLVSVENEGRWIGAVAAATSGRSLEITLRTYLSSTVTEG